MNISSWLVDTVYLARYNSTDAAGDPSFAENEAISARVEYGSQLILGQGENSITYDHKFVTTSEVGRNDRVWLPMDNQADNQQGRRVLRVVQAYDKAGVYNFYEVYL